MQSSRSSPRVAKRTPSPKNQSQPPVLQPPLPQGRGTLKDLGPTDSCLLPSVLAPAYNLLYEHIHYILGSVMDYSHASHNSAKDQRTAGGHSLRQKFYSRICLDLSGLSKNFPASATPRIQRSEMSAFVRICPEKPKIPASRWRNYPSHPMLTHRPPLSPNWTELDTFSGCRPPRLSFVIRGRMARLARR